MKILLAPSETKTPNGNNKFEINSLIFSKLYFLQDSSEVTALASPKAGTETPVPSQLDRKIIFDIVFNAIHGIPGENGEIQSYLRKLNIPQSSSEANESKITFDKNLCKKKIKDINIEKLDKDKTIDNILTLLEKDK